MTIDPVRISGNWAHGWALACHTLSSALGEGAELGCAGLQTERSELGAALYALKYRGDSGQVGPIAAAVAGFVRLQPELAGISAVLAVPPSDTNRSFQPVTLLAAAIGAELGLPAPDDYLLKKKQTPALKNVRGKKHRRQELEGAFGVSDERFAGSHLLLFDDLYRSGETLKAVTAALLFDGQAAAVSVIAATYTRTHK